MAFQSPSGVLGVCRVDDLRIAASRLPVVSVPFRGFRGLQARRPRFGSVGHAWREMFQSPSGVLGVCRIDRLLAGASGNTAFQSPSGVLGVCRAKMFALRAFIKGLFQSPSGVLGVCRSLRRAFTPPSPTFQSPSGVLGVCRSGSPNPPGWCGCPTLPGLFIPCAF